MPFTPSGIARTLLGACLAVVALASLAPQGTIAEGAPTYLPKIEPAAVDAAAESGSVDVLIRLSGAADLSAAYRADSKVERGRLAVAALQAAARSQGDLLAFLERRGAREVEPFWVANVVAARVDAETLELLARRLDVERADMVRDLAADGPVGPPPALGSLALRLASAAELAPLSPDALERGMREIGVDRVWRMGYRGEGAIVAITDTGVRDRHPALVTTYRGADTGHDYNWFDAVESEPEPLDEGDHGTHVAGIVAGVHGARQIGAAPGVEWIACRLIKQRSGNDRYALSCLQWLIAPTTVDGSEPRPELAPDIVNASWGNNPDDGCHSARLRDAVRSLEAAGILFVSSAGNNGDECQTVCVPGAYPEAFAVANYDVGSRRIHATSSRGPVRDVDDDYIKPDIAAPGTDINSSVPPTGYGEKTGTSMASPHVAGVAALILSARPDLRGRPEALKALMTEDADEQLPGRCGPAGDRDFNNDAGHGLIQAYDSVVSALTATPPPTASPTPTRTNTPTATNSPTASNTPIPSDTPPPTATRVPGRNLFLPALKNQG